MPSLSKSQIWNEKVELQNGHGLFSTCSSARHKKTPSVLPLLQILTLKIRRNAALHLGVSCERRKNVSRTKIKMEDSLKTDQTWPQKRLYISVQPCWVGAGQSCTVHNNGEEEDNNSQHDSSTLCFVQVEKPEHNHFRNAQHLTSFSSGLYNAAVGWSTAFCA